MGRCWVWGKSAGLQAVSRAGTPEGDHNSPCRRTVVTPSHLRVSLTPIKKQPWHEHTATTLSPSSILANLTVLWLTVKALHLSCSMTSSLLLGRRSRSGSPGVRYGLPPPGRVPPRVGLQLFVAGINFIVNERVSGRSVKSLPLAAELLKTQGACVRCCFVRLGQRCAGLCVTLAAWERRFAGLMARDWCTASALLT